MSSVNIEMPILTTKSERQKDEKPPRRQRYSLHSQIKDISYRIDLKDWIFANKCSTVAQIHRKFLGGMFKDSDGNLRYENTWQLVSDEEKHMHETGFIFHKTGCFEITLLLACDEKFSLVSEVSKNVKETQNVTIRLLADWEKLWQLFASDDIDIIRQQIPLLRAFVDFFFHKRTAQLYLFLYIYQECLYLFCSIMSDTASPGYLLLHVGLGGISIVFYVVFFRLYRGPIFSIIHKQHGKSTSSEMNQEGSAKEKEKEKEKASDCPYEDLSKYTIHWKGAFRRVFLAVRAEIAGGGSLHPDQTSSLPAPAASLPSYREYHRYQTLTFEDLLGVALKFLTIYCPFNARSPVFHRRSYRLSLLATVTLLPAAALISVYTAAASSVLSQCQDPAAAACLYVTVYTGCSLLFLTDVTVIVLFYGSLVVCLVGLCYGAEIAYWMSDSWIRRFGPLRRVSARLGDNPADHSCSIVLSNSDGQKELDTLDMAEFANQLTRDAIEHYLFVVEYMRKAGEIWSPVLAALYLLTAIFLVIFGVIFGLFMDEFRQADLTQILLYALVQVLLYAVFPTVSLAHANAFIDPLSNTFQAASPDDFQIIGGREKWMNLVSSVPAAWTVFGLWITWSKIFALASTLFTFLVSIATTLLLSSA